MKKMRSLAVVAFTALVGCGGGGGAPPAASPTPVGPPPMPKPVFSAAFLISPTTFNASTQENTGKSSARFEMTVPSGLTETLFVRSSVVGTGVHHHTVAIYRSTFAAIHVIFEEPGKLGIGTFDSTLHLTLCADLACSSIIGAAALPLRLTVTDDGYAPPSGGLQAHAIPLPVNDVAWAPAHERLYFSIPSAAGPQGNVILSLDPTSGEYITQFAGSEPNRLAVSDDGQYLYAGIDGAARVQRFRLPSLAPDLTFSLGEDPRGIYGAYHAGALEVAPGSANTTAVSLFRRAGLPLATGGIAIFDGGVRRSETAPGEHATYDTIQWGLTPSDIYAATNSDTGFTYYTLEVDNNGARQTSKHFETFRSFWAQLHFEPIGNRLYNDDGRVVDPKTGALIGEFAAAGPMVPDGPTNTAFFGIDSPSGTGFAIASYDLTTLALRETRQLNPVDWPPRALTRWGDDGLAIQTLDGLAYVTGGSAPRNLFATEVPRADATIGMVPVETNDLVWDASHRLLYGSVPGDAESFASSVVAINPETGEVVRDLAMSGAPEHLAISDDNQFLYVSLDDAATIVRLKLPGFELDTTIPLGSHPSLGAYRAVAMEVAPGAPRTLAVSRGLRDDTRGGLVIYDDDTPRPTTAAGSFENYSTLQWGMDDRVLYSSDTRSDGFDFYVLDVDATGVRLLRTHGQAMPGFSSQIQFDRGNGLLYCSCGVTLDPATGLPAGRSGMDIADSAQHRGFGLTSEVDAYYGNSLIVGAYDLERYRIDARVNIDDGVRDSAHTRLVRFGEDGLAVSTRRGLHLFKGALVSGE